MKKAYSKPRFAVELFSFSQSIASGCGVSPEGSTLGTPTHATKDSCGWDLGDFIVFAIGNDRCETLQIPEEDSFEGYCYNNPDGGITIFSSV